MTKTILLILALPIPLSFAAEEPSGLPMNEIRRIYEDGQLSDVEIVAKLTRALNDRVAAFARGDIAARDRFGNELATIVKLIAERPFPNSPRGRPEAIKKVMLDLDSLKDKKEMELYLRLSLVLAGDHREEGVLIAFIESDARFPYPIQEIALDAMRKTHVPIQAIPRLLALSSSSWSYVVVDGVGPQNPQRVFPLRNQAFECLQSLGIKCKKESVMDDAVDPAWQVRLSSSQVTMDRRSLLDVVGAWVRSKEDRTSKAAAEVLKKLSGADVESLVVTLLKDDRVAPETKNMLREQQAPK